MNEDRVLQALKALADNDRESEASAKVEERVLRGFHRHRARIRWHWAGVAALAAGVAIVAVLWTNGPRKVAVDSASPVIPQARKLARPSAAPVAALPRHAALESSPVRRPETREVVTDFFPLMNPAPPFERGQILRVQLPAAAMQTVGLPVREDHLADPIEADVVVGEEGMPRAIRFVRFDVQ